MKTFDFTINTNKKSDGEYNISHIKLPKLF